MIIETKFGKFEILKDYREAFNEEDFLSKYIDGVFDKYTYIVGDISSTILRLKGFNSRNKGNNSYKHIPDYLSESCNANCPHYVLKRIREENKV